MAWVLMMAKCVPLKQTTFMLSFKTLGLKKWKTKTGTEFWREEIYK